MSYRSDRPRLSSASRAFAARTLPLLLATLWTASAHAQPVGVADPAGSLRETQDAHKKDGVAELESVTVYGERSKDEIGHDNVYDKDISNVYVDRQYMDRYRGVSVGDVFAGMNGVYNSDNRNGSALSPNIRGLSGNGRIPVTVDGTMQSVDVWMARQGLNNRNYLDPNLFRSVMVEKGPSMTRGLKSGIGGAVEIRTIEAEDVITDPDRNWGLEIKLGTASNSVKPSFDPHSIVGKDYRDIPGAMTATPLSANGVGFYQPLTEYRDRGDVSTFNGDDRKIFVTGAYKHQFFDVLAAYSNTKRGNYFAGKNGVDDYVNNHRTHQQMDLVTTNLYPNIGRLYLPGREVPYTSSNVESILLKGNAYLPHNQKISLSYTRNKLEFGELPSLMTDQYLLDSDSDETFTAASRNLQYPFPLTTVDQDVYRLGYEFKPEGSRLINLEATLWHTDSKSRRFQNGDTTYQVQERDQDWNRWVQCNHVPELSGTALCTGLVGAPPPARQPNTDGRYDIFIGNEIQTRSTRTGVDLSNKFQLAPGLALTAAADYQYERQRDHVPVTTSIMGIGPGPSKFGPASGRREEWGLGASLEWAATDRLNLSLGGRYSRSWSFDDELDKWRAAQHPLWAQSSINTHQKITVGRLLSDAELAILQSGGWNAYARANNLSTSTTNSGGLRYTTEYVLVPLVNGKADSSQNPFVNGAYDINEKVENPQGRTGVYDKYRTHGTGNLDYERAQTTGDARWTRPEKQKMDAWSSMFAASYMLTDRTRVYGRYSLMARFPSIHEASNTFALTSGTTLQTLRPERSQNWEFGLAYNFDGQLPGVKRGDIKISYYHNTIRDFYDRTVSMTTLQFDRKRTSGIELQSRFDTGRFFGGLSATYRLKQEVCDADYAVMLDPVYNRMPRCMEGGMPGSLGFNSLQPRYSINLDLGTRLLENKLDLGVRWRYHSEAENKTLSRLLARYNDNPASAGYRYGIQTGGTRPFHWSAVSLIDLYAEYRINRHATLRLSVDNLMDRYYLDPLSKVPSPGPGRTVMLDTAIRF